MSFARPKSNSTFSPFNKGQQVNKKSFQQTTNGSFTSSVKNSTKQQPAFKIKITPPVEGIIQEAKEEIMFGSEQKVEEHLEESLREAELKGMAEYNNDLKMINPIKNSIVQQHKAYQSTLKDSVFQIGNTQMAQSTYLNQQQHINTDQNQNMIILMNELEEITQANHILIEENEVWSQSYQKLKKNYIDQLKFGQQFSQLICDQENQQLKQRIRELESLVHYIYLIKIIEKQLQSKIVEQSKQQQKLEWELQQYQQGKENEVHKQAVQEKDAKYNEMVKFYEQKLSSITRNQSFTLQPYLDQIDNLNKTLQDTKTSYELRLEQVQEQLNNQKNHKCLIELDKEDQLKNKKNGKLEKKTQKSQRITSEDYLVRKLKLFYQQTIDLDGNVNKNEKLNKRKQLQSKYTSQELLQQ